MMVDDLGSLEQQKLVDKEDKQDAKNAKIFANIALGAPQKHISFAELEKKHQDDCAFHDFRACFEKMLNEVLKRDDSPVKLNGQYVLVASDATVSNHFLFASLKDIS
jgi:hypothetical protein